MPPPADPLSPPSPLADDEEEIESGESGDSDDDIYGPCPNFAEIWMPQGQWRAAARYAYCYVGEMAAPNPAPFIRSVLDSVAQGLVFELLPSSRGSMLLRFRTTADCEFAISRSPVVFEGVKLELERSADTSNRFQHEPEWLALFP